MARILVVDDKADNRYYLLALLRAQGFEAEEARHGIEALAVARRQCPDLVLSDLLMPVMDGYTLLRHWKADARLRRAPFVVYTATYTEPEDEKLALELGADAFLLKPAEPEELLARVAEVLSRCETAAPAAAGVPLPGEGDLLKEYSTSLIRKLEEKTLQLEEANRALRRDIAERERAERALRESEQRFRQLAENIQEVFWITDPAKRQMLYVSPAYERIWGRTCESLYAAPEAWLDAVHPEDRERVRRVATTRQTTGDYDEVFRIVRPDGSVRWIRDRAFPVRDEAGELYRIVGTAEDTTHQVLTEQALQVREREQRALAGQLEAERSRLLRAQAVAKVGSWETELASLAVTWTEQTHRIFETDPATFRPTHEAFLALVHPDDRERVDAAFRASIERLGSGTVEHRIVVQSGRIKHVHERWEIVAAGGEARHAIGTCQDITERVALEEQLRRAQRLEAIGHLTGGVAHDFNNLLTVILGNAELLEKGFDDRPDDAALAAMILHAAQRGADLTHRLLAFARKQDLAPRPIDLRETLSALEPMLRRTLGDHVDISVHVASPLRRALLDPAQLDNAILNLCVNARDAMPDGGRLIIEAAEVDFGEDEAARHVGAKPGRYAMLAISDTGTGIAPEHLAHIFEPFFTTKEPGKGTGLGLATTYGFITQSGGHISVYTEPGHGTTVKLFLPLAEGPEPADTAHAADAGRVNGTETILLVEDNDLVRRYACGQLAALGYDVIETRNGDEALAVLRGPRRVDLLFTDVVMPGLTGPQLAATATTLRPALKVLYTSGYTENAFSGKRLIDPGAPLLMKPYRPGDLGLRIRSALDRTA